MGANSTYTARKFDIMHAIVRAYIDGGEPVASRDIARQRRDGLSAATVRNVMADLCDEGFLVPTAYFCRPRSDGEGLSQLHPVAHCRKPRSQFRTDPGSRGTPGRGNHRADGGAFLAHAHRDDPEHRHRRGHPDLFPGS